MDKKYTHKKVNPDGTTTLWGKNGYVGKLPAGKQPKHTQRGETLPERAIRTENDTLANMNVCTDEVYEIAKKHLTDETHEEVNSEVDTHNAQLNGEYTVEDLETLWELAQEAPLGGSDERGIDGFKKYDNYAMANSLQIFMRDNLGGVNNVSPEVLRDFLNHFTNETLATFLTKCEPSEKVQGIMVKLQEIFEEEGNHYRKEPVQDRIVLPSKLLELLTHRGSDIVNGQLVRLKNMSQCTLSRIIETADVEILTYIVDREDLTEDTLSKIAHGLDELQEMTRYRYITNIDRLAVVQKGILSNPKTPSSIVNKYAERCLESLSREEKVEPVFYAHEIWLYSNPKLNSEYVEKFLAYEKVNLEKINQLMSTSDQHDITEATITVRANIFTLQKRKDNEVDYKALQRLTDNHYTLLKNQGALYEPVIQAVFGTLSEDKLSDQQFVEMYKKYSTPIGEERPSNVQLAILINPHTPQSLYRTIVEEPIPTNANPFRKISVEKLKQVAQSKLTHT